MASLVGNAVQSKSRPKAVRWRRARGVLVLLMGGLALVSPFFAGTFALFLVGLLLIASGVLEMFETFHLRDEAGRRSAYLAGVVSVAAGVLLLSQPTLLLRGLSLLVAASFLIDGIGKIAATVRTRSAKNSKWR